MTLSFTQPYKLLLAFLFICCSAANQLALAQTLAVADYKRTGDVYFSNQDFYSAAQYYNKALGTYVTKADGYMPYVMEKKKVKPGKLKDYQDVVYKLAESYRHYNDFTNAEKYYGEAVQFDNKKYPLVNYWYGICLRSNSKYSEALEQFQLFKKFYTTNDVYANNAAREIDNCAFGVKEMKKVKTPFTIKRMAGNINEGGANYAPVWWDQDQLMFTSSRPVVATAKMVKGKNPYINHLYVAKPGDSGMLGAIERIELPAQEMEQGVTALTPDGVTMYVTQWSVKDGKKHADIYKSSKSGSGWSEVKKIEGAFNIPGYSTMQPAVSSDGKYILFSSDRPGGLGGLDLWYATLDASDNPGTPVNLGTAINTEGDEQAPFYDANLKVLVFSTNGRVGLGNQDLFQSKGDFSAWSIPENLGYPLNSPKDDLYFTNKKSGGKLFKTAYISSDRESVCCLELFSITRKGKSIMGKVLDCEDNQPLSGARVSLVDTVAGKVIAERTLDASGTYSFDMDDPGNFKIMAEKDSYFAKALYVRAESMGQDTLFNRELCLKRYEIGHAIILKDIYYDFNKATLRPESAVVLDTLFNVLKDNPKISIELSAHTDSKGSDEYNLKLSDARAKSCVDYLISKGVDPSRLQSKGYGECCPVASNTINGKDNPDGRALNRRTEFKVLRN